MIWVYISHQKRDQPIIKLTHMFLSLSLPKYSLETTIVDEAQKKIQTGFPWINNQVL